MGLSFNRVDPGRGLWMSERKRGRSRRRLKRLLLKIAPVYLVLYLVLMSLPPIPVGSGVGVSSNIVYKEAYYCFNIVNATLYLLPESVKPITIPVYAYFYTGNRTLKYEIASINYVNNVTFYDNIGGSCIALSMSESNLTLNTDLRILIDLPGYYLAPMPPTAIASLGNGSYIILFHQPGYSTFYTTLTIALGDPTITVVNNMGYETAASIHAFSINGSTFQRDLHLKPHIEGSTSLYGNYTSITLDTRVKMFFLTARVTDNEILLSLRDNYFAVAVILAVILLVPAILAGLRKRG
jgi:hypothetical protein